MNSNKFFESAKDAGITASEVSSSKSTSFSFSLFKGELVSYSVDSSTRISARGIYNNKIGFGSTESDDKSTTPFLLDAIKETATLNESEDEPIIYKGADKYQKKNIYSAKLNEWSVEDKLALCHKIEDKLKAADPRITDVEVEFQNNDLERTFTNSYGLKLKDKSNYFLVYASIVIKDGEQIKTNGKIFFNSDQDSIDVDTFCNEIVQKGLEKLNAESIKVGKYKAVIDKECVSSLLSALLSHVSSEEVQKHSSKLEGKLNEKVLSEKLTVFEKPHLKNIFFSYFDDEGVPTQDKVIFDKGVLKTYFYNLVTAKKDGVQSTGNASRSGSKMSISYSNIVVKPGKLSKEGLFNKIKNGIYVTEINGLHAGLNPTSGDFSLQAEGFHIVDGKKDKPITLFTLSGNLFDLFNNIIAVGNDSELLLSSFTVPSIAFKNLKVSAE